MFKVTYINREPRKTGFSIEGIFSLIKDCLKGRVEIGNYDMDPRKSWLRNVFAVRKHAGDINHVTGDVNFLLLWLWGKKNLLTVHDMGHYDTLRGRKVKHIVYHYFWFYLPLKNATYVTVISNFTRDKLLEYFKYPPHRIRVVYDPVKPIFRYHPKEALNAKPRILQIGTGKHKNLTNLIAAVEGMDVHLDIVAMPDEAMMERLRASNVPFTVYSGLTDAGVNERYVACDLLFFASFYEGFGMPIIEAQSVGRPVITSNLGAMKEVAGDSAVLVDPSNVDEIKSAINEILTNRARYNALVASGRDNIVRFHHEKIAQDYLNVYQEMLQRP